MAIASGNDPYRVHVLAGAEDCPADNTCFLLGEVPARPGKIQAVARVVDDQRLADAYADRIGLGGLGRLGLPQIPAPEHHRDHWKAA
jgi:hypothetical protein